MREAYAQADLVICAAGAGTLAEVEVLKLSALVVPIETVADGHQAANAAAFAARTGLPTLREVEALDREGRIRTPSTEPSIIKAARSEAMPPI